MEEAHLKFLFFHSVCSDLSRKLPRESLQARDHLDGEKGGEESTSIYQKNKKVYLDFAGSSTDSSSSSCWARFLLHTHTHSFLPSLLTSGREQWWSR